MFEIPPAVFALWCAMAIDLVVPEPPNRWHPVAWIGSAIAAFRRIAPTRGRFVPFFAGTLLVVIGASIAVGAGLGLEWLFRKYLASFAWIGAALVLKTTFSLRQLGRAGSEVQRALQQDDLPEARRLLSWHLVSRETGSLTSSQVAAATIESLTENASDSVVAPLLYYALGGLPAALAYRFVNTADAMLGYRDAQREWLGKASARSDDLLNWIPARVTALLMGIAGCCLGASIADTFRTWRRDRWLTASPNAGQPMSVAAGALGLELEKVGHYSLGHGFPPPAAGDIARARRLLYATGLLTIVVLTVAQVTSTMFLRHR